jgi:phenylalanyl-tRNA synthetase beta chain
MQISLKWLNESINIETFNLNELIDKLTLGGFEVEEILEIEVSGEKQLALDISATANRSDSLSIQGILAEIVALFNQDSKILPYLKKWTHWQQKIETISLNIPVEENYSTFLAIKIENLTDTNSPKWIKEKLVSSGIKPLDNLLDFQNFILLETGYPFAFYDLEKIYSKLGTSKFKLAIDEISDQQNFTASNGINYQLNNSTLLIKANELTISIAGIIENKEFIYSKITNSLLIEGSIFNAAKIRQQSRNLGLRTDRSARYEKSLKNTYLTEAFYRLISLLRISNPNLICKFHTSIQTPKKNLSHIYLKHQTINEILGPINNFNQHSSNFIHSQLIISYLDRLKFQFLYNKSTQAWEVTIPHSRSEDLTREIDLVEEIGRLHGFNNFLTTLPKIKRIGKEDSSYQTRKKITYCLLNLGFNELIHYSLVNETTFLKNEVKLLNPLLLDCSNLRSSLLPNLINTVHENLKQGNSFLEGFEYGHVFSGNLSKNLSEEECIAGVFGGLKTKPTWSDLTQPIAWFEAKGKMEQLFQQLNISVFWKSNLSLNNEMFHSYRTAHLYSLNGEYIGVFGQIHPILANQLSIFSNIYLFEFNVELIQNQIQNRKLTIYKKYSLYPKIIRDLSFIINENIGFEKIYKTLYVNGTKFLSEINLLDEYKGDSIPDKHTSLCLQLIFQSNEKTLQNKEIESIIQNCKLVLAKKFDATLRE